MPHSPEAADHELAVWAALDVRPGDPLVPLLRAVPFTTLAREEVCGFVAAAPPTACATSLEGLPSKWSTSLTSGFFGTFFFFLLETATQHAFGTLSSF